MILLAIVLIIIGGFAIHTANKIEDCSNNGYVPGFGSVMAIGLVLVCIGLMAISIAGE